MRMERRRSERKEQCGLFSFDKVNFRSLQPREKYPKDRNRSCLDK